jgi:hypothetical protein
MQSEYKNFRAFYPYYLSEHANATCRILHFTGCWVVLTLLAAALATGEAGWLAAMPFAGYGFAWAGHFFFEHNRPATFTYPLFSLAGDWVMFYQLVTGRISFTSSKP